MSLLREECHKGVNIHRVFPPNLDKNNFFKRTLRLFFSSFQLFLKVLFWVQRGDELLVVTTWHFCSDDALCGMEEKD